MDKYDKQPQCHWRGSLVPPEAMDMLEVGEITPLDFTLLAIIIRFVDPRGQGCLANNKVLGQYLGGVTTKTVQKSLERLHRVNLITVEPHIGSDGEIFRVIRDVLVPRSPT